MVLLSESSSEISSLSSDSPEPEYDYDSPAVADETPLPPSKRQKVRHYSRPSSVSQDDPESTEPEVEINEDDNISTDSSADVPNSPINAKLDEEESQEQVTVCEWEGCHAGDLGDMDKLVSHIEVTHIVKPHIENRQKKYTCEWTDCPRKGLVHASGYALKAHMSRHTRQKPFYCYLPECDRSFTRSDALAKHMRTVHETEALRPSDPVPKSMQSHTATGKGGKLKIILKTPQSLAAGSGDFIDMGDTDEDTGPDSLTPLTTQHGFSDEELNMGAERLWKLCVAHVRWSTAEGEALRRESERLEEEYHKEWLEKEVLLDQVAQVEEDYWTRRQAVMAAEARHDKIRQEDAVMGKGKAIQSAADLPLEGHWE